MNGEMYEYESGLCDETIFSLNIGFLFLSFVFDIP